MVIGYNFNISNNDILIESNRFDRYLSPENYDCNSIDEINDSIEYKNTDISKNFNKVKEKIIKSFK